MEVMTDKDWMKIIDLQINNLEKRKFFGLISENGYSREIENLNRDYHEVYQRDLRQGKRKARR